MLRPIVPIFLLSYPLTYPGRSQPLPTPPRPLALSGSFGLAAACPNSYWDVEILRSRWYTNSYPQLTLNSPQDKHRRRMGTGTMGTA